MTGVTLDWSIWGPNQTWWWRERLSTDIRSSYVMLKKGTMLDSNSKQWQKKQTDSVPPSLPLSQGRTHFISLLINLYPFSLQVRLCVAHPSDEYPSLLKGSYILALSSSQFITEWIGSCCVQSTVFYTKSWHWHCIPISTFSLIAYVLSNVCVILKNRKGMTGYSKQTSGVKGVH